MISLADVKQVSANPGSLMWTAIDTPSQINNIIVSPSEINFIVIGSDGRTFYAVDIPDLNAAGSNGRLYKSGDGGVTWQYELSAQLIAAGASMPVWNIAVAPDDVNFIVAVTSDNTTWPVLGPKLVYISTDGGATWQNTNLAAAAGEWISCVDISVMYDGTNRDIAIGTRTGFPFAAGRVYVRKSTSFSAWSDQGLVSDVVALKFSPTYPSDSSLVVVSSDGTGTRLHLGIHDTTANNTAWDIVGGYPVVLWDATFAPPNSSPNAFEIITADLELPSDFSGQDSALRRFYVSSDAIVPNVQVGVYRIDDTVPHRINPPTIGRISSIAYFGTYAGGVLLAGEVNADPALARVNVWKTSSPMSSSFAWDKSDAHKSPTGGGNSGNANAQVAWSPDGTTTYCGTSSACLGAFNAPDGNVNCPEWPEGHLNTVALDESAFSVSPYAPAYGRLLTAFGKATDSNAGYIWNQLSLIDTEMDVLTDVAALEAPQTGENLATTDYDILYLFSKSDNTTVPVRFNSVWRSTSDPLGRTWERVLCLASDSASILRVRQPSYDESGRSDVVVFATPDSDTVGYSANEGQVWDVPPLTTVTDLALSADETMYVLNNTIIYKYQREGTGWVLQKKVDTGLDGGHTIAVPLKNPGTSDMVVVGEAGPPNGSGRIAYADFTQTIPTGICGQPVPGEFFLE